MPWLNKLRGWFSPPAFQEDEGPVSAPILAVSQSEGHAISRFPRFSAVANESEAIRPADLSETARLNLAFSPSQPIADLRRFAGRAGLIEKVISAIEDRRMHLIIHGDRGIGKTSILHVTSVLAREARYLVRYVSCSEDSDFDETFRGVAAGIPLLFHEEYDPTSPETERGATLSDVLGDRQLTPAGVSEAFAKLTGTRVLVILDEYDRASSPQFRLSIAELIKNLSDRSARAQLVLGGVAANLNELVEHIPSIRRNVLGIAVGAMSDGELSEIVDNAEAIGGLRFSKDAEKLLITASSGSPFVANLLGQQSARRALSRLTSDVEREDVVAAIGTVTEELEARLTPAGAKQLAAMIAQLPAGLQGRIGRFAQTRFGKLDTDLSQLIAERLGESLDPLWWDREAGFRLCDDGLATLLSLHASLAPEGSAEVA